MNAPQLVRGPHLSNRAAQAITRNVADVDAGRITWDEFGARQRAAWDSVTRGEPNIIGSACNRRMVAVHKAFAANRGAL